MSCKKQPPRPTGFVINSSFGAFIAHVPAARLLLSSVKQRRKQAQKGGDAFLISKECSISCHHDIRSTGASEWTLDVDFYSFHPFAVQLYCLVAETLQKSKISGPNKGGTTPLFDSTCFRAKSAKGGGTKTGKLQGGTSNLGEATNFEGNHLQ